MPNIKKKTREFLRTAKEYCDNQEDCNGCFFNIDLGMYGSECRLEKLKEMKHLNYRMIN